MIRLGRDTSLPCHATKPNILKDWEKQGLTRVVVARTRDGNWLEVGVFFVDAFCLGVKGAFLSELPATNWPGELDQMIPPDERVAMDPACIGTIEFSSRQITSWSVV